MKLLIERTNLLKSLGHMQSVVERRNTIPILSNVKLNAEESSLSLNATDLDVEISEKISANISSSGATTAPAHTLYEIVRKLPEGSQVELNATSDSQLALSAGRFQTTLSCLPIIDFPVMGSDSFDVVFQISANNLRDLIDRTKFAISTEETRYYLNGIYLHIAEANSEKLMRAVATDGHRLASFEVPMPKGAADMPGIILPRKTITELRKLIDEIDASIEISVSENKIQLTFNQVILISKLIDGTFPDYQRVIPNNNDQILEIDRRSLTEAVDRVSAISNEKSRAVKLNVSNNKLILEAFSPDHGSATEEVEANYSGTNIEIGFNSAYLMDIARQIKTENINISMADAASPTIFRESSGGPTLYVLMPMRV